MAQARYREPAHQDDPHPRQPSSFFPAPYPRRLQTRLALQQAHLSGYTMVQPIMKQLPEYQQMLQRMPAISARTQSWQTDGLSKELGPYTSAPATDEFFLDPSLPRPSARYDSTLGSEVNNEAYRCNHGLPVAVPMITSDLDYQGILNNHYDYTDMSEGRSAILKSEADYTNSLSLPFPMRRAALLQPVGTKDGSDFGTGASSLSPRSAYFSEPSDRDATFSPKPRLEEAKPSNIWAKFSSVSPTQIKQSPSESSSPSFQPQPTYTVGRGMAGDGSLLHTNTANVAPSLGQRHDTGFGSQISHFRLPWADTMGQNDGTGAIAWHTSTYMQMAQPTQLPYYSPDSIHSFPQGAQGPGSNLCAEASGLNPGRFIEMRRNAVTQRAHGPGRSTDEQAQREIENQMLLDGKAAGLTYKDIRAKMGTDIAESTLRGRYRALIKDRKDRVRKPVWTPKDIRLLREIVGQQLDSLDDGPRSVDGDQRLSKVSWKKVGEYIVEQGGSYKFGNSTCKKKWLEIEQRL